MLSPIRREPETQNHKETSAKSAVHLEDKKAVKAGAYQLWRSHPNVKSLTL